MPDCDTASLTTHIRNYLNITNTYESDLFADRDHGTGRAGDKDKFFEGQRQGPTTPTPKWIGSTLAPSRRKTDAALAKGPATRQL